MTSEAKMVAATGFARNNARSARPRSAGGG